MCVCVSVRVCKKKSKERDETTVNLFCFLFIVDLMGKKESYMFRVWLTQLALSANHATSGAYNGKVCPIQTATSEGRSMNS